MTLLPREHGAYGQLTLPLLTAFGAAGISESGLLLAGSALAAFVAHEPASILLGLRGPRARRELRGVAASWLACCTGIVASMEADTRWSLAVPAVPAMVLAAATVHGRGKSWYAEVAAAAAFAGLAVPVTLAAGAPLDQAAAIGASFALIFIAGTLAVRAVILAVRGGGSPRATSLTRRAAVAVTGGGIAGLAWLTALDALPPAALAAVTPGLLMTLLIAARSPHTAPLRSIGWTLVAASTLTAVVLVAAL
jgi:hypothetical protein